MFLNIAVTLITALSLAAVAAWFSIIGFTTIYAGAVTAAIVMGIVAECGKVVATSWLYRNWEVSSWLLKIPLIFFVLVLMIITSLGVFGFLSKAHLDQGAATLNNAARIEQLNYQISREQSLIKDSEKVIEQLDSAVNALVEANRIDRSISVRRNQATTRQQLREEIQSAQERIDQLNQEKFSYESEIRNLELEIGPVKYIAELIYGNQEIDKDITKSAVQLFTLLIVITLDPLAVFLLIAANQSMLRLQNQKATMYKHNHVEQGTTEEPVHHEQEIEISDSYDHSESEYTSKLPEKTQSHFQKSVTKTKEFAKTPTDLKKNTTNPWATQEEVLRELMGSADLAEVQQEANSVIEVKSKYPEVKGWFDEFKGTKDGRK